MNISHLLTIVLIIVIIYILGIYIQYKYYTINVSDYFTDRVILGQTDNELIVDRNLTVNNMTVDNILTGSNITSDLLNAKKFNLKKLCGPGTNNCIITSDVLIDQKSINNLNNNATRSRNTINSNIDRLTQSITSIFTQTESDISQQRSVLNANIQRSFNLIDTSTKKIEDLFTTIKPINSDVLSNLQNTIRTDYTNALTNYNNLQKNLDTVKSDISSRIAKLEVAAAVPSPKLWILFGPYRVGYQSSYDLPYNNYTFMTFTPNVTIQWFTLYGLRCNTYPLNPITAPKDLYGIELLKPDGTPYVKDSVGEANKFYIRIGGGTNRGKVCKIDIETNVLLPVVDPGPSRGNEYYFYFTPSHHPRWYYMYSTLNNYFAVHNHFFIRFTTWTPQQTQNDAFLWMIV